MRARFRAAVVHPSGQADGVYVKLVPVAEGSKENDKFFATLPEGEIKFSCLTQEAGKEFVQGEEYFVEFSSAGKPTKVDPTPRQT